MTKNKAAWIKEQSGKPLIIEEAEDYKPEANQVVVRNEAVAINPVDWVVQVSIDLSCTKQFKKGGFYRGLSYGHKNLTVLFFKSRTTVLHAFIQPSI
jgi:hypothetical protein